MKQKGLKIAACFLAGTITISSLELFTSATNVSAILPAAGIGLALEEGTSVEIIQNEIKLKVNRMINEQMSQPSVMTLQAGNPVLAVTEKPTNEPVVLSADNKVPELVVEVPVVSTSIPTALPETQDKAKTLQIDEQPTAKADGAVLKVYNVDKIDFETALKALRNGDTEITEDEDFSDLLIADVNDYVNVRSLPSTDGDILGKLYGESVGRVISETEDGWYEITSGSVTGFVKAEYCIVGDEAIALIDDVSTKVATVAATTLNVRKEPNTDTAILTIIPLGEEVLVIEELDGWVKVSVGDIDGYVSTDYVAVTTKFITAESKEEEAIRLEEEAKERRKQQEELRLQQEEAARNAAASNTATDTTPKEPSTTVVSNENSSALGIEVANYALQFEGNPYVYGGTSLTNGADCSGFVLSVYANFGVELPHSAHADRKEGYAVEGGLDNAQPGDLICYEGHIGIYIGDGKIIHASTRRTGIKISKADYKPIVTIRRIF